MKCFYFFFLFLVVGCSEGADSKTKLLPVDSEITNGYEDLDYLVQDFNDQWINSDAFCQYLSDPLWEQRDAYDAAHILIVPLEYAFEFNEVKLINCFSSYVEELKEAVLKESWEMPGRLNWIQHLHFIARYYVLSDNFEDSSWVYDEFKDFWSDEPAWLWGRDPFHGVKERIDWKLTTPDKDLTQSYYNVIFDEDYFSLS